MIPLVLLAGFLGAGKTRFLTELIPRLHAQGVKVRVLLNDFENASVDAARLGALQALVTPLDGECVCCSSLKELTDALYDVPADPGSVLLIEANGATEADELIGHLTTDGKLAHFTPPLQVTVIDAGRWQKRWWHNTLEAAQARTATHVHLNWTDRLSVDRMRSVEQSVEVIAPRATRSTPAAFAGVLAALVSTVRDVPRRRPVLPIAVEAAHAKLLHAKMLHAPTAPHVHPFASAALPLPKMVERAAFMTFARALPPAVVRAKGLVRFADTPDAMFVWNRMHGRNKVQLDRSWPHADAQPVGLFIGVQLPVVELERQIGALGSCNPTAVRA